MEFVSLCYYLRVGVALLRAFTYPESEHVLLGS
jgi:hypothetical protein